MGFWEYAKFSIFEDQGPEDEKDLGPGPPLRTVWPVPVQDRDSPTGDPSETKYLTKEG